MARYIGPKNRLSRREGVNLGLKTGSVQKVEKRLNIPPGQHGVRGRKKLSEYGTQLREKQKAKRIYGLLEKQFKTLVENAQKQKGLTGETLLADLERRLDNTVFRLGFASTRQQARQLVTHGHILVNGKKVNIPSYPVSIGDVISFRSSSLNIPWLAKLLEDKSQIVPEWLERKAAVGKVVRLPKRSDIEADITEQLIVEFYSR